MTQSPPPWHADAPCHRVTFKKFAAASDKSPGREHTSTDAALIHTITDLLARMPVDGELFVSFPPEVSYMQMQLECGSETSVIEFYSGKVKTPGTSFYASGMPEEEALVALVKQQLK